MFNSKDKGIDEERSLTLSRRLTGSEMVRLMMGQTKSEQKEVDISLPESNADQPSYNHYSMSFDVTYRTTAEDNIPPLKPLKEVESKEENEVFTKSSEEEDDDNDDNGSDDNGSVNEEYLNKSAPQNLKSKTIGSHYNRQACRSETIFPAIPGIDKRTATTLRGPHVVTNSPVEHPERRKCPASTSVTRMNAFRRSKLGSRISMELFPSTQVSLLSLYLSPFGVATAST